MFLSNLNVEIVACILLFRKSRHKQNLESTSKYSFSPDLGGKNGGVLSMRMQAILDSPFARPGSAPTGGGKKGEFRDWTTFIVNLRDNSEHVNAVISGTGGLQENRIFRFLKIHKKNRFSSKSKKCFRRSSLHDIQNQMEKLKKLMIWAL